MGVDVRYLGPLIVNLDLVIPAIIKQELEMIKLLSNNSRSFSKYKECFTISPKHIMSFAFWLKTLHFGRVVVNFTEEDAFKYLRMNSDVYEEVDNSQIFIAKFSEYTEENIQEYIDKLTLNINYDTEVLEFLKLS